MPKTNPQGTLQRTIKLNTTMPARPVVSRSHVTTAEREVIISMEPPPVSLSVLEWIIYPNLILGTYILVVYTGICGSKTYSDRKMEVLVEKRGNECFCLVNTAQKNKHLLLHWLNICPAPLVQPHCTGALLLALDGLHAGKLCRWIGYNEERGLKLILLSISFLNSDYTEAIIQPETYFDLPADKLVVCPLGAKVNATCNKVMEPYHQIFRKTKGR